MHAQGAAISGVRCYAAVVVTTIPEPTEESLGG
jgi:hypothetical protein